ncbi:MAG: hypothetical protein PF693_00800, partial [Spirochaetia bacterium]|nr:hypothetical protein [Spirochaetia bacterium]
RHFFDSYSPDAEIPLHVYNRLDLSFEINEGSVTIFPYYLYKFNNKRNPGQNLEADGNDFELPEDFINQYKNERFITYWDSNEVTLQYLLYLPVSKVTEKNILDNLIMIEGAAQWLYNPEFKVNTAYWPNIPVPKEEIIEIVETPPWTYPETSPVGDLYILSIGIDIYSEESLALSRAGVSANEFADMVAGNEKDNYKQIHVETISDIFVSKNLILEKIETISDLAVKEDTIIIYISSHGISDIKGRPFVFASDGEIFNLTSTCLPLRTLHAQLSKNKGLVLSIMDVGRTGSWVSGREAFFSFNPDKLSFKKNQGTSIGFYSVSSGNFTNTDSYSFPDLLKETTLKNSYSSIIDEQLWSSSITNDNPNGIWSNSSGYTAALEERKIIELARNEFLVELAMVVNSGDKEVALEFIKPKEKEKYFSQNYLDKLKESINKYF